MIKPEVVIHAPISLLGEGPHYEKQHNRLVWVDIEGFQIHRMNLNTDEVETLATPQRVGALVATDKGTYICGLEDGIYELQFETGQFSLVVPLEADRTDHRANDGKCDPHGRFWIGTYHMGSLTSFSGNLYSFENGQLRAQQHLQQIGCSNGMAWSADEKTFYYIDSPTKQVYAFDYDGEVGTISNQRTIIYTDEIEGVPDGMTIDKDGHLWIAHWGGSCISQWDVSDGTLLQKIIFPVSQVTSLCFTGEQFDTLYVTTAKIGLSGEQLESEPLAGALFKLKLNTVGTENFYFKS